MFRVRHMGLLALVLTGGCASVEPSERGVLAPRAVVEVSTPAAAPVAPVAPPDGGYDFDADDRREPAPGAEAEVDDLYGALGLERPAATPVAPTPPAPVVAEPAPPAAVSPAAPPGWSVDAPVPGSWGVRLISTVVDAQPPRAILGMSDGTEQVVQPGTLLPGPRLVVLAIGRDAVQVAEIIPQGDHARVETRVIQSLHPQAARPSP